MRKLVKHAEKVLLEPGSLMQWTGGCIEYCFFWVRSEMELAAAEEGATPRPAAGSRHRYLDCAASQPPDALTGRQKHAAPNG